MRIRLPVPLIREMDAAIISGAGGYSTRAEFIVDAIQERILELTVEEVEDAGPPPMHKDGVSAASGPPEEKATHQQPSDPDTPVTIEMTELVPRKAGFSISPTDNLSRPEGKALFGLHNRDYPSLWALNQLAEMANEEPIPVVDYYARVLDGAWNFGEHLLSLEEHTGRKCTALFPTNRDKRKSAEGRFCMFAIGEFRTNGDKTITTRGPLYEWRAVGLIGSVDQPRIGLTAPGWRLLAALDGLSVDEPHAPASVAAFLTHLREHAPDDMRGFVEILTAIGPAGATRQDVLDHAGTQWPDWSENEVSTNTAGYIARAREWGLVEPKQTKSQYHLTPLGVEHLMGGKQ